MTSAPKTSKTSKTSNRGMSRADLVIHPMRLRIIQAFGGRRLTARQLAPLLPDIPQASLYRHLSALVSGGVLEVVEHRPVRAVQEKVYALVRAATNVGPDEYEVKSAEEHRRYFATFIGLLLGDFERYLEQHPDADVRSDGVAFYQLPAYLSDEEYQLLIANLRAVLMPALAQQRIPGRRRRLLSVITMPAADDPPASLSEVQPAEEP